MLPGLVYVILCDLHTAWRCQCALHLRRDMQGKKETRLQLIHASLGPPFRALESERHQAGVLEKTLRNQAPFALLCDATRASVSGLERISTT